MGTFTATLASTKTRHAILLTFQEIWIRVFGEDLLWWLGIKWDVVGDLEAGNSLDLLCMVTSIT